MQPIIAGRWPSKLLAELRIDEIRQVGDSGGRDSLARPLFARVGRQAMFAVPDRIRLDIPILHHERSWLAALARGDLIHAAGGGDRCRIFFENSRAVFLDGMVVVMFDQQPVGPLAAITVVAHPDQDEAAMQPLALQDELEISLPQGLLG